MQVMVPGATSVNPASRTATASPASTARHSVAATRPAPRRARRTRAPRSSPRAAAYSIEACPTCAAALPTVISSAAFTWITGTPARRRPGLVRLEVGAADLQPGDDLGHVVDRARAAAPAPARRPPSTVTPGSSCTAAQCAPRARRAILRIRAATQVGDRVVPLPPARRAGPGRPPAPRRPRPPAPACAPPAAAPAAGSSASPGPSPSGSGGIRRSTARGPVAGGERRRAPVGVLRSHGQAIGTRRGCRRRRRRAPPRRG